MAAATREIKQIGTHSGSFHCDEAMACFMLRVLYPTAEIIRSRDPKVLDPLPILVDVGSVYDPSKGRYDHHQKGFFETFDEKHKIKLSSAGLVYKHYGREVVTKLCTGATEEQINIIYGKVYDNFIEALDGIDNGVNQYPADVRPAYSSHTDLSSRVGRLNPGWNEKGVDIQARFLQAVEMTGREFTDTVLHTYKSWIPARELVKDAIVARHTAFASGEIVKLNEYTLWKGHLLSLEQEMKLEPSIKYVLYPDENKAAGWRVQAVPVSHDSFDSRVPLHADWRGIRDADLSRVSGIEGCIFVHASGFIGGANSYEGALAMAVGSLAARDAAAAAAATGAGETAPKKARTESATAAPSAAAAAVTTTTA